MNAIPDYASLHRRLQEEPEASAEQLLEDMLQRHGEDPGACHFAGLWYFWRALEAERAGLSERAESLWMRMIPHLVFAWEHPDYMEHFRASRERIYGQEIAAEKLAAAKEQLYNWMDSRLEQLASSCGDGSSTRRDEDLARIRQTQDRWRLERMAARLVRRLGGIPNAGAPARCVVAGPAYARVHGFYNRARAHLAALEVQEKSFFQQVMEMIAGAAEMQGEAGTGEQENVTPEIKREAGYCFSHLDMAYVFYRERQFGRALDALTSLAGTGAEDGASLEQGILGEAAQTRHDARQLALGIRVALGAELLHREDGGTDQAFAYWGEAIKDVDLLDEQSNRRRQGDEIRKRMMGAAQQRVDGLAKAGRWDEALVTAESLARIIPREGTLRSLVQLLMRRAVHCANELHDQRAAAGLLQRARVLAPDDAQIRKMHLAALSNAAYEELETAETQVLAEHLLDVMSVAREVLVASPDDKDARSATMMAAMALQGLIPKLDPERDKGLIQFSVAALQNLTGQIPKLDYDHIEGIRFANRAFDRAREGRLADAFGDAEEALRRNPENDQIRKLYTAVAVGAVNQLCDQEQSDRAREIADKAHASIGKSPEINRCRTRLMLRRMDPAKLLSEDPEDLAALAAMVGNWLDEDAVDDQMQERAKRFGAIMDPDLQNERKLRKVQQLMGIDRWKEAADILDSLSLTGKDDVMARTFAMQCRFHLKDLQGALAVADQMVADHPQVPYLRYQRAKMLSCAGRFDEAEESLMAYREERDADYDAVLDLSMNSYRAGRYDDAMANARLARRHGVDAMQTILIECLGLMRKGDKQALPAVVAQTADRHRSDPNLGVTIQWLAGQLSDQHFLHHAENEDRAGGSLFWLGEKLRAQGDTVSGNALIRQCLQRGATKTYEYEHALAMSNGGRLQT